MFQASGAQTDFQKCSHQLTQKVWDELQALEDKKQEEKGIQERETNDILEEEAQQGNYHSNIVLFNVYPLKCTGFVINIK